MPAQWRTGIRCRTDNTHHVWHGAGSFQIDAPDAEEMARRRLEVVFATRHWNLILLDYTAGDPRTAAGTGNPSQPQVCILMNDNCATIRIEDTKRARR